MSLAQITIQFVLRLFTFAKGYIQLQGLTAKCLLELRTPLNRKVMNGFITSACPCPVLFRNAYSTSGKHYRKKEHLKNITETD
jgi:hypothetical protein